MNSLQTVWAVMAMGQVTASLSSRTATIIKTGCTRCLIRSRTTTQPHLYVRATSITTPGSSGRCLVASSSKSSSHQPSRTGTLAIIPMQNRDSSNPIPWLCYSSFSRSPRQWTSLISPSLADISNLAELRCLCVRYSTPRDWIQYGQSLSWLHSRATLAENTP